MNLLVSIRARGRAGEDRGPAFSVAPVGALSGSLCSLVLKPFILSGLLSLRRSLPVAGY